MQKWGGIPGGSEKWDEIPGGMTSENGYPQQGGTESFWKSPMYVE